jgi:hypothetical protein
VPVGVSGQGGHLSDQAQDLNLAARGGAHGLGIRVKSGKRRNRGNQYSHRMGIVVKAVDEFLDVLVDHGVALHQLSPLKQISLGWQFPNKE